MPTEKAHGVQIIKMCEAFALNGLAVELIVPQKINLIKDDIFKFYDIRQNFKIKKIYSLNLLKFKRLGKMTLYLDALFFAINVFIYILFNRNKFRSDDIFYLRDEFSPWLLAILNKKIFLEIHAFKKRFKYYRIFFPKLKGLILITKNAKEEFIDAGIIGEKILISPDAVDLSRFNLNISQEQARRQLNLPFDKKIVAYAGSFYLYSWKGIDILLESSKNFSDDFLFVLIGGTEKEIQNIKNQYQLNNVLLITQKPSNQIPLFLKAADILVLPNKKGDVISEKYTSPLKMFEYMASKRPIVASDLPSIREILNEANSILIDPNNPQKLAEGIKKALDQNLSKKITQQAFSDVQNYTWEKRAENILKFICAASE